MTEVKAETIRLIHTGARDLQIANLLNEKYGFPNRENDFLGPITQCRAEIKAFLAEAPDLARQAFEHGYSWSQVVEGLEKKELLHSGELIAICVKARDSVFGKTVDEKHIDDVLDQQRKMLDDMNKKMIEAAHALAAQVEGTTVDPALRAGISAFESMISENEQDKHDNANRNR
jgi:hypothetical protein